MAQKEDIITLDGPSGVGKSTVARALAAELGYRYLDTGAMYRAVTLAVVRVGLSVEPPDVDGITRCLDRIRLEMDSQGRILLQGEEVEEEIRGDGVTRAVSRISALEPVRTRMVTFQRRIAASGRIVAEGRDLGSVVFPDVRFKFYLDADPLERARRRAEQRRNAGEEHVSVDAVLRDQERRDRIDSERACSPLRCSADMIRIDTTRLSQEEVVEELLRIVRG